MGERTRAVATVDQKGVVTAKKDGKANIYCLASNGKHYKCVVSVTHTHQYVAEIKQSPCTQKEYKVYRCSICGKTYADVAQEVEGHHWDDGKVTKKATCTVDGVKTYSCTACLQTRTVAISKTGHQYHTVVTKAAALKKNGSIVTKCKLCGSKKGSSTISYPKTLHLSKTAYTYNGHVQRPRVAVIAANGKVISSKYYKVTYSSGCKYAGKYAVRVTFKGNYSGYIRRTYHINPKSTTVTNLSRNGKKITVSWKRQSTQTSGYQIQICSNNRFKGAKTVTVRSNKETKKTISVLSASKTYYVRIRTYKYASGKGYYSGWSGVKYVKLVQSNDNGGYSVYGNGKYPEHGYIVSWSRDDVTRVTSYAYEDGFAYDTEGSTWNWMEVMGDY